jgi:hypothetical protein
LVAGGEEPGTDPWRDLAVSLKDLAEKGASF